MAAITEYTHPDVTVTHQASPDTPGGRRTQVLILDRECGVGLRLNLSGEHADLFAAQLRDSKIVPADSSAIARLAARPNGGGA